MADIDRLGEIGFSGTGSGTRRLYHDLVLAAAVAAVDGSWARLKACGNDECQVAFWDSSRNRAARFCSTRCARRVHQRAYRTRRSVT